MDKKELWKKLAYLKGDDWHETHAAIESEIVAEIDRLEAEAATWRKREEFEHEQYNEAVKRGIATNEELRKAKAERDRLKTEVESHEEEIADAKRILAPAYPKCKDPDLWLIEPLAEGVVSELKRLKEEAIELQGYLQCGHPVQVQLDDGEKKWCGLCQQEKRAADAEAERDRLKELLEEIQSCDWRLTNGIIYRIRRAIAPDEPQGEGCICKGPTIDPLCDKCLPDKPQGAKKELPKHSGCKHWMAPGNNCYHPLMPDGWECCEENCPEMKAKEVPDA